MMIQMFDVILKRKLVSFPSKDVAVMTLIGKPAKKNTWSFLYSVENTSL